MSKHLETRDSGTQREAKTLAEIDLVLSAQGGDTAAFSRLVRLYQRRAVSIAYRLLGNTEDAGDVSQEAFVRAYRHLEQLDDASRFGGWLLRIVSNLALNFRRARSSRSAVSLDDSLPVPENARRPATGARITDSQDHDAGTLSDELQTAITEAIERLPDKQRLALVLFSVEGMPQKEVAEILECSVELVKWNVFQARRKLKEMLKEHLDVL